MKDGAVSFSSTHPNEQRLRAALEASKDGIVLADSRRHITFWNEGAGAIFGYSASEVMGQPLTMLIPELRGKSLFELMDDETRAIAQRNIERRRKGIAEAGEIRLRRKDGSDLWVIFDSAPVFDERGGYVGVLSMVMDLTARKQMERALRE